MYSLASYSNFDYLTFAGTGLVISTFIYKWHSMIIGNTSFKSRYSMGEGGGQL